MSNESTSALLSAALAYCSALQQYGESTDVSAHNLASVPEILQLEGLRGHSSKLVNKQLELTAALEALQAVPAE